MPDISTMLFISFLFFLAVLLVYLVRVVQLEGNGPNLFVVVPLLAAVLLTGIPEFRWQSGEDKGAHLITYVSGVTDSDLQCQRMMGAFYDYSPEEKGSIDEKNPKLVHLKYAECMNLVKWFSSDTDTEPATSEQAFALHLLIYEAIKVGEGPKVTDLAAECEATARYVEVAKYAGTSAEEADRMLEMYKSDWYPYMPVEVRKPCP